MDRTKTNYLNAQTNELTLDHDKAVEWYRNGAEVEVWSWSETLQIMVNRVTWVH